MTMEQFLTIWGLIAFFSVIPVIAGSFPSFRAGTATWKKAVFFSIWAAIALPVLPVMIPLAVVVVLFAKALEMVGVEI